MIADYKNLTKMSSFCSLVEPLKVAHFEVSGEVDLRSNLRDSVYRKKNREHQNRTEASLELGHSTLKDNDLAFFEEWVKVDSSP